MPEDRRRAPVLDDASGRAGRARRADRGALRRPAGHRVGARGRRASRSCRPARSPPCPSPRRRPPTDWSVPDPKADLLPGQHRRAAARPALAAVRRPRRRRRSPGRSQRADGRVPRAAASLSDGDVGLPDDQRLRLLPLQPLGPGAGHAAQDPGRLRLLARRRAGGSVEPLARRRAPALRRERGELGGAPGRPALLRRRRCSRRWSSCWTRAREYYTAVQTIIPLAASSEVVFSGVLRPPRAPRGRPAGGRPSCSGSTACRSRPRSRSTTWPRGRASTPTWPRPCWPHRRQRIVDGCDAAARRRGATGSLGRVARALPDAPRPLRPHRLQPGLRRTPVPADDPAPLVGHAAVLPRRPGERTRRAPGRRGGAAARRRRPRIRARLDPARRAPLHRACSAGRRRRRPCARTPSPTSGLAWPRMRRMLLELGRRLVAAGVIARAGRRVLAAPRRELRAAPAAAPDLRRRPSRSASCSGGGSGGPRRRRCSPGAGWLKVLEGLMPAATEEQTGRHHPRRRRQRGPGHRHRPGPRRARGLRPDAAGGGARGEHHHPGLDLAVRHGRRRSSPTSAGR